MPEPAEKRTTGDLARLIASLDRFDIPAAVFRQDDFLDCNPAFLRWVGLTREEVLGLAVSELALFRWLMNAPAEEVRCGSCTIRSLADERVLHGIVREFRGSPGLILLESARINADFLAGQAAGIREENERFRQALHDSASQQAAALTFSLRRLILGNQPVPVEELAWIESSVRDLAEALAAAGRRV